MKYLKKFENHSEYETYIQGGGVALPNVSYCEDNGDLHYNPYVDPVRFVAVFNVTSTSEPTHLFSNYNYLSAIEIDGTEYTGSDISANTNYTFDTTGIHTVKYTLNDGITSIDGSSFAGDKDMISITIPSNITTITNGAFSGCYSLVSVTIPNSVTSIGNAAFSVCYALRSINIPNSVISIDDGAFGGCNLNFENITFESVNPNATFAVDATNKIVTNNIGDTLILGFNNTVAIPNAITTIEDYAFNGRKGLISITIPSSVTSIGSGAFARCSKLENITVDTNNTTYDSRNNCNAVIETSTNTLIAGCKNTIIPNTVTSIGNYAFQGCGLTSITIPNSVTSIRGGAFDFCSDLISITIPSGITKMCSLQDCSALTTITCLATTAPSISYNTNFLNIKSGGTLYVPIGSTGYNTWMRNSIYYLGYYGWTKVEQ